MISVQYFAENSGGIIYGINPEININGFSLDTRLINPGELFIAVQGSRMDGTKFAKEALNKGAVAILTEKPLDVPHILVNNIIEAIAQFGHNQRKQFHGSVVGITGSIGKTSTKEFTVAALSSLGAILKSPGNRNTEYTSPLLWADLSDNTKITVVEMAMRGMGQIRHLAEIAKPNVGVITMIGNQHVATVGSRQALADAKTELFEALPGKGIGIYWAEDDYRTYIPTKTKCKLRTFGFSEQSECRILGYRAINWEKSIILGQLDGQRFEAELPIIGRFQALNAAAALLVAHTLGVSVLKAAEDLSQAQFPPLRMDIRKYNDSVVLLDAYNTSIDSAIGAIKTFAEIPVQGRRVILLSEIGELAEYSESGHRKIGRTLAEFPCEQCILFGQEMIYAVDEAIKSGYPAHQIMHTMDLQDFKNALNQLKAEDMALIKGRRILELEKMIC